MQVLSVNVAQPQWVVYKRRDVETGIFKQPVAGRVMLRTLNLDGDGQADLDNHGGVFKAAYVYSEDDYAYWRATLNRDDLTPGKFGENFTVAGLTDDTVHIGDVFRVGGARVQVTQPRVPCFKLAMKLKQPDFAKQFLNAKRTGFYLRVLTEGEVGAGDTFTLEQANPVALSVRDVLHLMYFDPANRDGARRALQVEALSDGWYAAFAERVEALEAAR